MTGSGGVTLRAVVAAAGVAALLIVVALSAGSVIGESDAGRLVPGDREQLADVMRQVLTVAYVALLANALYLWLSRDRPGRRRTLRRRRMTPLGFLSALLTAVVFVALAWVVWEGLPPAAEPPPVTGATIPRVEIPEAPVARRGGDPPAPSAPLWGLVAVGGAALALALLAGTRRARPEPTASRADPPGEGAAAPSRAEVPSRDPRGRVFAAYRAVEATADERGVARGTGETVTGHLRRLGVPAAARLGSLYNRARYSRHVVTSDEADEAQAAGDTIRRELQ